MSLVDPRRGDAEDDASSTKRRTLLAIAGSLLAEISIPKLITAWVVLIVLPSVVLGLAPLIVSGWFAVISRKVTSYIDGLWAIALLVLLAAFGWIGGRRLARAAEQGFWSLNSLAVQPGYALWREGLRHLAERVLAPDISAERRTKLRAAAAAGAGIVVCVFGLLVAALAWQKSRWIGDVAMLSSPLGLAMSALANAVVLVSTYLAGAALVWGIADATMDQPRDLAAFDPAPPAGRSWRVAHLSDLHTVGEHFGFRIECGRAGPRGNERLSRTLARLNTIHVRQPLDLILITGDVTDAGRSSEWAEFLTIVEKHPQLARRILLLPGNHDVNVVDRANPARLDLPTSPGKRLRLMRVLSAMEALQGNRVRVIDARTGELGESLSDVLAPHRAAIAAFADAGTQSLSAKLVEIWNKVFPMVLPPDGDEGLGVILLNSNAESHFSFTNALGLVSSDQMRALTAVTCRLHRARWIVALHHHLVEYPRPAVALSERIGTALINGTFFVRQLQTLGGRVVAMHGHRHIDWVGECGGLRIVSAPSPVMEATDDEATCFHIHTLAMGLEGGLCLLAPERVDIPGTPGGITVKAFT
jgi:predicted MPP superfamily phosphohydrolase